MRMSRTILHVKCLQFHVRILDERLKPLLEVVHGQFLTLPVRVHTVNRLGWYDDVANDLDDTVGRNAVLDRHRRESVDFDIDVAAVAEDINSQRLVLQKSREINLLNLSASGTIGKRSVLTWKMPLGMSF